MLDDFEYYTYQLRRHPLLRDAKEFLGKCPNGCTLFDEYDEKLGFHYCPLCGDAIRWK